MTGNLDQEILTQEDRLTLATQTLDIDTLDRIYADDITMTGVLGEPLCGKSTLMDEARRGIEQREQAAASSTPLAVSYEKEDIKVVSSADMAVTTYRFVVTLKGGAVDVNRRYRSTNVWMRRPAGWRVVAAHTAFVIDPKQAALLAGS
jgi:ketosteroid isomerase-like protein